MLKIQREQNSKQNLNLRGQTNLKSLEKRLKQINKNNQIDYEDFRQLQGYFRNFKEDKLIDKPIYKLYTDIKNSNIDGIKQFYQTYPLYQHK